MILHEVAGAAHDGASDHGLFAFFDGRSRDDHPFKETPEGQLWIAAWQEGWDFAALFCVKSEGEKAAASTANPYPAGSAEAAAWLKGWKEKHKLAVVDGHPAPAPRRKAG